MEYIEGYLNEKMEEKVNAEKNNICSHIDDYKSIIEDIFMDVVDDCEKTVEPVRRYRKEFIDDCGENEEMWYDDFREDVTDYGIQLATEVLIAHYLETHVEPVDGVYSLKLSEVPVGFKPDDDNVDITLRYKPGEVCVADADFKDYGESSTYELYAVFEDYEDFEGSL